MMTIDRTKMSGISKLASMDSLAAEYDVGRSTIARVIHGVTWREENYNKIKEIQQWQAL